LKILSIDFCDDQSDVKVKTCDGKIYALEVKWLDEILKTPINISDKYFEL